LRALGALLIVATAVVWCWPRAMAAWQLQTVATRLADYALCMVGPTGPVLIRDNLPEFQRLIRRRLIAAPANERPFAACAAGARDLTGDAASERAHRATAWSFVEYGGGSGGPATAESSEMQLQQLNVTARPVVDLSRRGWPFVRGGYMKLVRPSIAAREAVHPVELPKGTLGRGLPNWRAYYRTVRRAEDGALLLAIGHGAHLSAFESRDAGVTWSATSPARVAPFAERCIADDAGHAFSLSLSEDGRNILVTSSGPGGTLPAVPLGSAEETVFAAACDRGVLVAALKREAADDVNLVLCPLGAACSSMPLPRFGGIGVAPRYPLDVARVGGTTVVAVAMQGLVRVASSRDNGQTWTPLTVIFDATAHPNWRPDVPVPARLLTIGSRVMLYGGASRPEHTYPVLFSDDHGASFR
jgi:hypothetical protein